VEDRTSYRSGKDRGIKIEIRISKKILGLITFVLAGALGGTGAEFQAEALSDKVLQYENQIAFAQRPANEAVPGSIFIRSEPESIRRGRSLFDAKCKFCHHANSTETIVGPGLKGILKNRKLPVSKLPATPESIIRQLKQPFNQMPSFEYLTDEEISDIMSFLNTL